MSRSMHVFLGSQSGFLTRVSQALCERQVSGRRRRSGSSDIGVASVALDTDGSALVAWLSLSCICTNSGRPSLEAHQNNKTRPSRSLAVAA